MAWARIRTSVKYNLLLLLKDCCFYPRTFTYYKTLKTELRLDLTDKPFATKSPSRHEKNMSGLTFTINLHTDDAKVQVNRSLETSWPEIHFLRTCIIRLVYMWVCVVYCSPRELIFMAVMTFSRKTSSSGGLFQVLKTKRENVNARERSEDKQIYPPRGDKEKFRH